MRKAILLILTPLVLLGAGIWLESFLLARQPSSTLVRLLTVPSADIQLSSPLWDYRTTLNPAWTVSESTAGIREYSWSGTLQTDPDLAGIQVVSEGKEMSSLTPEEWEKTLRTGYVWTPSREKLIFKNYFFPSDHTQFFVAHFDWSNPLIEWESLAITPDGTPIQFGLAVDTLWSSTVELSTDDWVASTIATSGIEAGTHILYLTGKGTYSALDKSLQKQLFVRNVKAKSPASIRVRLAADTPAPAIRYRPSDPVVSLLSQPEIPPQPAQSKPWNQYDESTLFVRPLEIGGLVRTGVFLPTPSEWRVTFSLEQPADLLFFPTVRDPSSQEGWGVARLEVLLETGADTRSLWLGDVNPAADEGHALWTRGIRIPLGCRVGERTTLVFRSRGLPGREGKSRPLLLGEPILVAPADPPRKSSSTRPMSVILISVDTLRADAVGAIGGGKATPWIDQFFGNSGVVWSNAEAPSSWTLPSHASLMLSQHLSRHGVVMHYDGIPAGAVTLAEHFSSHNYETAAFVDREFLNYRFGFHQGFVQFDQLGGNFKSSLPRCLDYLRSRDRSIPLFLFLHTYDTHDPYDPPEEYRKRFLREGLEPSTPDLAKLDMQFITLMKSVQGEISLGASDAEYMRSLYLAEVAYVDDMLGSFLEEVRAEQLLNDPLVVLVSDHGEAFLEHKSWLHGTNLYEEVLKVPVLFRFPQKQHAGHRIEGRASLLDVPPSLFEILGWEAPGDWQGASLLPQMRDPRLPLPRDRFYSELVWNTQSFFALIQRNHKFINKVQDDIQGLQLIRTRGVEAYDLGKDPGETANLASSEMRQATQELDQAGRELSKMHDKLHSEGLFEAADLDPATIRSLQGIGYLRSEKGALKKPTPQAVLTPASTRSP